MELGSTIKNIWTHMEEDVTRLLQTCSNQPHGFTLICIKLKQGASKDAPHKKYQKQTSNKVEPWII